MKRNSRNHLLLQKSKRQKNLDRTLVVDESEHKKIESMLPYL